MAVSTDENIAAWRAWAQDFQARYPQQAVANYLLGDALARSGDVDGAIAAFTAGLQLEPANPLLLNARGTAYAIVGDRQAARQDLLRVADDDRPLMVAQVGAGSLILDRRGGSSDARSWFDSALSSPQPDDALAHYGRALTWVAEGDWAQANADLEAALASAPCIAPLVATQLAALQEYMEGGARVAPDGQDADSGFALSRVIQPFLDSPTQQNAAALLAYLAPNPQDVPVATSILKAQGTGHPLWASAASQQLSQVNNLNVGLQGTYTALAAAPGAWTSQATPSGVTPPVSFAPAPMASAASSSTTDRPTLTQYLQNLQNRSVLRAPTPPSGSTLGAPTLPTGSTTLSAPILQSRSVPGAPAIQIGSAPSAYPAQSAAAPSLYPTQSASAPSLYPTQGASAPSPFLLQNGSAPSPYLLQSAANLPANTQLVNALRDAVGPGITAGGIDTSLQEARFDRGDWPAVTYYGLLYPAAADRALP
jgi:tetratricopeptide (TPR) repeat protein